LLDILKLPKGYILIQPHSNEIIIRRNVKFDEIILTCEPNLTFFPSSAYEQSSSFVPSLAYNPYLTFVPYFVPIMVSYSSYDYVD
jgi:hypothetical protein